MPPEYIAFRIQASASLVFSKKAAVCTLVFRCPFLLISGDKNGATHLGHLGQFLVAPILYSEE